MRIGTQIAGCALAIVALSAILVMRQIYLHKNGVDTQNYKQTLCSFSPKAVDTLEVTWQGTNTVTLSRKKNGLWWMVTPYEAEAEASQVERLIDVATVIPVNDCRTKADLERLQQTYADFALEPQQGVQVRVVAEAKEERIIIGGVTATGNEVYARLVGDERVVTLPFSILQALPNSSDDYRKRVLMAYSKSLISGIDLRVPNMPFMKLVKDVSGWKMQTPVETVAETKAVELLLKNLLNAKVISFVLPSADNPNMEHKGEMLPPSRLVRFGLVEKEGYAVTLHTTQGEYEQVVLGSLVGTNQVYALVQNGRSVVTLDAAIMECCKTGSATFRDTRVFPLHENQLPTSVSWRMGKLAYVLKANTNGIWSLTSPVVAPADQIVASRFVDCVLRMRQDVLQDNLPEDETVWVTVGTATEKLPNVKLSRSLFKECGKFDDLRSKKIVTFEPDQVRRVTVKQSGLAKQASSSTLVVDWDEEKSIWMRNNTTTGTVTGMVAAVRSENVNQLLATLVTLEATGVERIVALPDDLQRCGLVSPTCIIALDFKNVQTVRQNLILGASIPNGGIYATVGGADAIFILSPQQVKALTISLTE